jgi:transcriptional regulator with XRE-family HTH domain
MSQSEHPEGWRARLRAAVDRSGKKHGLIAEDAGIAPATLSRVINGKHAHPRLEIVASIAHACGETGQHHSGSCRPARSRT